jgi:hypothetical protein
MKLSDAIYYVDMIKEKMKHREREAIELVLETLQSNVDVDAWDREYELDYPMCVHCSGNGCASCKYTGDDI